MKPIVAMVVGTTLLLGLAQTASAQMYPSMPVSPPPGKPYAIFQQDDAACRQYANSQVAYAQQQAGNQVAGGAVTGAVGGALLGGLLGGGRGAAIGAGAGAVAGTAQGAANAQTTSYYAQQQFDATYQQCMASRGDMAPAGYQPRPAYQPGVSAPPPPPPPGSAPLGSGPPGAAPGGDDE